MDHRWTRVEGSARCTPTIILPKMSLSSIQMFADAYFNSLNPIAERISIDVAATKEAYENLWHTLSYKDRIQVIDETIIRPEVVLKYSFHAQNKPENEHFPCLRLQTGDTDITDDEGGKSAGLTWHDEHSAPFSWMTRSQLNLCIVDNADNVRKHENTIASIPVIKQEKPKAPAHKKTNAPHSSVSFIDPPSIVLGGSSSKLISALTSKLKFPPKSETRDDNLLTKIKNKTAILKIQTFRSSVSKTNGDNCVRSNEAERGTLIQSKSSCTVMPNSKTSKPVGGKAVISKPKTPPPPPPPCKQKPVATLSSQTDTEKMALLPESSANEVAGIQSAKCDDDDDVRGIVGSLDSLDNFHVELKIPSGSDTVPKTGFDFLDNW